MYMRIAGTEDANFPANEDVTRSQGPEPSHRTKALPPVTRSSAPPPRTDLESLRCVRTRCKLSTPFTPFLLTEPPLQGWLATRWSVWSARVGTLSAQRSIYVTSALRIHSHACAQDLSAGRPRAMLSLGDAQFTHSAPAR